MSTPTKQERLKRIVEKLIGLPTLPAILSRINSMMLNPRTSAKDIAGVISSDPAITSKILRVVNSSFYGFPSRITTVTHAIVILGFNTVKSIVLSTSIFDVFKGGNGPTDLFNRNEFWLHSIGVGSAAKVIARRCGYTALEEFFIAGLLHDVGKIVLDQYAHDSFVEVLNIVRDKNQLIVCAEDEALGTTHADIGGWLFQKWNLSKGLCECVSLHHTPQLSTDYKKPVAIVHLADIFARALKIGSGGDKKIPPLNDGIWQFLGLQVSSIESIMNEIAVEKDKAMIFLDFLK